MKTIIVAYDKNYGIGANNDLLWQRNLPADLQHFRDKTAGHAVIMGMNTYKSIGRPLPNRQNIVVTRQDIQIDGAQSANSLHSAYDLVDADKETFVIGGGQIYSAALDTADRIIATEVDAVFDEATVHFPRIDDKEWREASREKHAADERNLYNYDFVVYERR